MNKLAVLLILTGCQHAAANAYSDSVRCALEVNMCDWSEHESDNNPGCAYKEGQAAAEDADCVGDE